MMESVTFTSTLSPIVVIFAFSDVARFAVVKMLTYTSGGERVSG